MMSDSDCWSDQEPRHFLFLFPHISKPRPLPRRLSGGSTDYLVTLNIKITIHDSFFFGKTHEMPVQQENVYPGWASNKPKKLCILVRAIEYGK